MKLIYAVIFSIFLLCCQKKGNNNCESIQNVSVSYNGPVTIGDSLKIYTQEVGGYRIYSWRGPDNFMSQEPRNTIYDVQLKNEGWYYLTLSNNECNTKVDSIYADVKLQQGSPSCSIPNKNCTFNNLASDTYSSIQKRYDPTYGFLSLECSGTSDLDIYFHDYWKTHEPEDGIYETINVPSFGIDKNYNKVFISTIKSSIYFKTYEGQIVYVSHVNGKLQVRFCNLSMAGTNNSFSYTTLASGNLIQQ